MPVIVHFFAERTNERMDVIVTDADASFPEKWSCIEELFSERPVWSKHMLLHHTSSILPKEEMASLLSHFCYRFGDGVCRNV